MIRGAFLAVFGPLYLVPALAYAMRRPRPAQTDIGKDKR